MKQAAGLVENIEFQSLPKRKISKAICQKFGYGIGSVGDVLHHVAPYRNASGTRIIAQKLRGPGKDFKTRGAFDDVQLFGQHLWATGEDRRQLVITEGEIDALSLAEAQDGKWPVVSVPSGASAAVTAIKRNIEFVESFKTVVLMFDMDEPGQEAAQAVADILTPGKVKIAHLPEKDASDVLVKHGGSTLIRCFWDAKEYRPDGVIGYSDFWEILTEDDDSESLPIPWPTLNEMTRGFKRGEIILLPASPGIGKSTLCRNLATYWHDHHNETIGIIALEEPAQDTLDALISEHVGLNDLTGMSEEEYKQAFEDTFSSNRWWLVNHLGCMDFSVLESRIKYLALARGCGTIILDHLLAAVEGLEDSSNDVMTRYMNRLRSLVGQLDIRLLLPTHLKSNDKNFDEGAKVAMGDIKWPALKQYSNKIISIERDQQGAAENIMTPRVLKCRERRGKTGQAGTIQWDRVTGEVKEIVPKSMFPNLEKNNDY